MIFARILLLWRDMRCVRDRCGRFLPPSDFRRENRGQVGILKHLLLMTDDPQLLRLH
jgi:hypothetical protein